MARVNGGARAAILALMAVLAAALALACTSENAPASVPTGSAEASPTAAVPTVGATPAPPFAIETTTASTASDVARSREVVDDVIEAVTTGDVDTLESLLQIREISCAVYKNGGPKPACTGDALSTSVPVFPAGVCAMSWYRDPRAILERFVERAGPLFAVIEGSPEVFEDASPVTGLPSGDFRVIFSASVEDQQLGYVAAISGGVVTHLVLGCSSPEESLLGWTEHPPPIVLRGEAFTAPDAPLDLARPDPMTAPRGDRAGIEHVDRVLNAVASKDAGTIRSALVASRMQCTHQSTIGSPPPCAPDEPEATVVDAFLLVGCESAWARPDLDAIAVGLTDQDLELYLVAAPDGSDDWYELLYRGDVPERPVLLWVSPDGVIGKAGICSTPEQWAEWSHVILRGPAWPEDTATPE